MNEAGVPFTRKDEVSLLVWPVGPCAPAGMVGMVGMATVGDSALTPDSCTAYSVLTLVFWFEIENEPSPLNEVPQGFLRLASVSRARPGMSETRLVWIYALGTVRSSRVSSRGTTGRLGATGLARRLAGHTCCREIAENQDMVGLLCGIGLRYNERPSPPARRPSAGAWPGRW